MFHAKRLIAASFIWAASAVASSAIEPQEFMLDNGMQVVVIEDHRAPVVVHMVWYKVGAADDPAGHSGIAHYLEHLMFKATDSLEEGEFDATVQANGGTHNAFTGWDYTAYHQRVAADRLSLMMEMEADRMVNLRLDRSDWLPERDVILRERGQTLESSPDRVFSEQMRAALYQNSPYGRPIIGWRHEMEQLTGDIATDFYRVHYAPNNAILVVAGDVNPQEVLALAQQYYGPIPAVQDMPERFRPQEPPQLAERRMTMHDARVGQPYMNRLYIAPQRRSGDQRQAAAYTMLAALLSGGSATSVLDRALTYDESIAVSSWASYNGNALDGGTFSLGIMPVEGVSLQDAEDALDATVAQFIEDGIDAEQLERVRMQVRAEAIYQLDDTAQRANSIGADLALGLTLQDNEDWLHVLEDVTPDEILAAARHLDRRESVTGWLMGVEE
ncbi:M16 family metallopeptidase [Pararhodobacter zhoushanensis]|uniref:Insulinase family protein n=1 Tax=Pararhodobacter zhoushanensis TaxID=2479545 RepID=A0ABT3GUT2_9RHOB|nr:pitrilysin family protein [Pararhodobacter zhoushanensis]MCW1931296.1 insulinase family protein [Pararhodobacter zhoushanensis]